MTFRYEIIGPEESGKLNSLLGKGWRPVRETPFSGATAVGDSSGGHALVLFEREGTRPLTSQEGAVSLDAICNVTLLQGFTDDELRDFGDHCEVCSFETGDEIFEEGTESRQLHIVLEGEVRIQISGLPLEDMEITDIGAGCVFGESTFFAAAPHTGTARCVTAVRTLKLDRAVYDEVIQSQCLWAYKLAENSAEILAASLQATDQWVWDLLEENQSINVTRSWHRFRERIQGGRYGS